MAARAKQTVEKKKSTRAKLSDDALDTVAGGAGEKDKGGYPFDCPFCGVHMEVAQVQDAAKHMTNCPSNPYK